MKLKLPKYDWKNRGPAPPNCYKPDPTIGKTLTNKLDYLKVNIKTQPRERDSKVVAIYVPLFQTGSPESLLKFVKVLYKIIRVQDLSMGPPKMG